MDIVDFSNKFVKVKTVIEDGNGHRERAIAGIRLTNLQRCLLYSWQNHGMEFTSFERCGGMTTALAIKMAYDIIVNARSVYKIVHFNWSREAAREFMDTLKIILENTPYHIIVRREDNNYLELQISSFVTKIFIMPFEIQQIGNAFDAIYADNYSFIEPETYNRLKMRLKNAENIYAVSTVSQLKVPQNLTLKKDIEYMQNKIWESLRVPKTFLKF